MRLVQRTPWEVSAEKFTFEISHPSTLIPIAKPLPPITIYSDASFEPVYAIRDGAKKLISFTGVLGLVIPCAATAWYIEVNEKSMPSWIRWDAMVNVNVLEFVAHLWGKTSVNLLSPLIDKLSQGEIPRGRTSDRERICLVDNLTTVFTALRGGSGRMLLSALGITNAIMSMEEDICGREYLAYIWTKRNSGDLPTRMERFPELLKVFGLTATKQDPTILDDVWPLVKRCFDTLCQPARYPPQDLLEKFTSTPPGWAFSEEKGLHKTKPRKL
jgi:hypothetical protein